MLCPHLGSIAGIESEDVYKRQEVLRSEFERSYNKGGTSVGAGRKALDAYVNKFIDFRLKIEAAEVAGLDTSRVFQKEQDEYRRCLIKSYLTDEETAEQEACLLYTSTMTC